MAVYGQELADGLGICGPPDQAVDKQIEALGYKTSDVTHVIASHFHFDHAGGTHLFPDAKHYAGQVRSRSPTSRPRSEPSATCPTSSSGPGTSTRTSAGMRPRPVRRRLPGAAVHAGPHAGRAQPQGAARHRTFLLTGDAVHLRNWRWRWSTTSRSTGTPASPWSRCADQADRGGGGGHVWITHDPDDWEEPQARAVLLRVSLCAMAILVDYSAARAGPAPSTGLRAPLRISLLRVMRGGQPAAVRRRGSVGRRARTAARPVGQVPGGPDAVRAVPAGSGPLQVRVRPAHVGRQGDQELPRASTASRSVRRRPPPSGPDPGGRDLSPAPREAARAVGVTA